MAEHSFQASQDAFERKKFRTSVSRAYYALYQSATALMIHVNLVPPEKGNWGHAKLMTMFEDQVIRRILKKRAIEYKQACSRSYIARASADYRPSDVVDVMSARETRRWAAMVMKTAEKVTGHDTE